MSLFLSKNLKDEVSGWQVCEAIGNGATSKCMSAEEWQNQSNVNFDLALADQARVAEFAATSTRVTELESKIEEIARAVRVRKPQIEVPIEKFIASLPDGRGTRKLKDLTNQLNSSKELAALAQSFEEERKMAVRDQDLKLNAPSEFARWMFEKLSPPSREQVGEAIQSVYKSLGLPVEGNPVCRLKNRCAMLEGIVRQKFKDTTDRFRPFEFSREYLKTDLPLEFLLSRSEFVDFKRKSFDRRSRDEGEQALAKKSLQEVLAELANIEKKSPVRTRSLPECSRDTFEQVFEVSSRGESSNEQLDAQFFESDIRKARCQVKVVRNTISRPENFSLESFDFDRIASVYIEQAVCCSDKVCASKLNDRMKGTASDRISR